MNQYRNRIRWAALALFASIAAIVAMDVQAEDRPRVLSIGGSVTEIVYALGQEDLLIGRDSTSQFPPSARDLPDVGYMRALSPEGVLSVRPDLILAEEGSGPPEVIEVLSSANLDFVIVPDGFDAASISTKIRAVAEALSVPDRGEELVAEVEQQLNEAIVEAENETGEPIKVLFVLSMRGGRVLASGTNTAADGIISLSGGQNAITEFEGYKPLSDEAVSAAAPDVILMMDRGGDHSAANEELFEHPALSITPAGKTNSVVRINGLLLLGFGPRTPQAVRQLSVALRTSLDKT